MWQILNIEPVYGVCSLCRSHECGIVDGKHQWIHTEALDDTRENIVIGYKCVKLFAENLGISKEIVEKVVHVPPTEDDILAYLRNTLKSIEPMEIDDNDIITANAIGNPPNIEHHEEPKNKTSHRGKATNKK